MRAIIVSVLSSLLAVLVLIACEQGEGETQQQTGQESETSQQQQGETSQQQGQEGTPTNPDPGQEIDRPERFEEYVESVEDPELPEQATQGKPQGGQGGEGEATDEEPVRVQSEGSVFETTGRLVEQLEGEGMEVSRVLLTTPGSGGEPNGGTAQSPGAEIVLFADPNALGQVGADPAEVLRMPHAVMVYQNPDGQTEVAYHEGEGVDLSGAVEAATGSPDQPPPE